MNEKRILLIALTGLSYNISAPAHASITEAELQFALKKYCVPPSSEKTTCDPNKLAKYDKKENRCVCTDPDGIWNPNTRECFKCQSGTYVNGYSCSPCRATSFSSWSASCGSVTRTKTTYCNGINSKSATDNPEVTKETSKLECPSGQICVSGKCLILTCPAGYRKVWITNGGCPENTYLQTYGAPQQCTAQFYNSFS